MTFEQKCLSDKDKDKNIYKMASQKENNEFSDTFFKKSNNMVSR